MSVCVVFTHNDNENQKVSEIMKRIIKELICVLTAFILLAGSAYVNTYYSATEEVVNAVEKAEKIDSNILVFEPQYETECGLIFYPGGKVEYTSYAPLMEKCAREGILCVLVKMPCNLAVLNMKAAEGIQEQFQDIKEWYMAGHSLGGAMAASYIDDHADEFEGLILLAAYSTEDLSEKELEVLSVYGTEDLVLNREKYLEYKHNLPGDYLEEIIDGGCHAYFGNYGEQERDGNATISAEKQQEITVEAIKNFMR